MRLTEFRRWGKPTHGLIKRRPTRAELFHKESHAEELEECGDVRGFLMWASGSFCGDCGVYCSWCEQMNMEYLFDQLCAGEIPPLVDEPKPLRVKLAHHARFARIRPAYEEQMQREIDLANAL